MRWQGQMISKALPILGFCMSVEHYICFFVATEINDHNLPGLKQ
jgi:hypothetical protein